MENINHRQPVVVVAAYDRVNSLKRLLKSLDVAYYPDKNVILIISIDKGTNKEVELAARAYDWKHGEKRISIHNTHLGLKKHILHCGELSQQFGSIILLEDDLYVSKHYYQYACDALSFYRNNEEISGISLYSHSFNETALLKFLPLNDGYDTFFMQIPSSWGQVFSKWQWHSFKKWYKKTEAQGFSFDSLPGNVSKWPETSWKKIFYSYLIDTERFFVYPRIALSTNFGDVGENYIFRTNHLQVPLLLGKKEFYFADFTTSLCKYDGWCELLKDSFIALQPTLAEYNFEVDLYGTKVLSTVKSEKILTTKQCELYIRRFSMSLKPHEMNVIENIEGDDIFLTDTANCTDTKNSQTLFNLKYYHDVYKIKDFPQQGNLKKVIIKKIVQFFK